MKLKKGKEVIRWLLSLAASNPRLTFGFTGLGWKKS